MLQNYFVQDKYCFHGIICLMSQRKRWLMVVNGNQRQSLQFNITKCVVVLKVTVPHSSHGLTDLSFGGLLNQRPTDEEVESSLDPHQRGPGLLVDCGLVVRPPGCLRAITDQDVLSLLAGICVCVCVNESALRTGRWPIVSVCEWMKSFDWSHNDKVLIWIIDQTHTFNLWIKIQTYTFNVWIIV